MQVQPLFYKANTSCVIALQLCNDLDDVFLVVTQLYKNYGLQFLRSQLYFSIFMTVTQAIYNHIMIDRQFYFIRNVEVFIYNFVIQAFLKQFSGQQRQNIQFPRVKI